MTDLRGNRAVEMRRLFQAFLDAEEAFARALDDTARRTASERLRGVWRALTGIIDANGGLSAAYAHPSLPPGGGGEADEPDEPDEEKFRVNDRAEAETLCRLLCDLASVTSGHLQWGARQQVFELVDRLGGASARRAFPSLDPNRKAGVSILEMAPLQLIWGMTYFRSGRDGVSLQLAFGQMLKLAGLVNNTTDFQKRWNSVCARVLDSAGLIEGRQYGSEVDLADVRRRARETLNVRARNAKRLGVALRKGEALSQEDQEAARSLDADSLDVVKLAILFREAGEGEANP